MVASVARIGRPRPEHLELVESVRVPLYDLAKSVAVGGVITGAQDLHQLAMEHALRLAPEYDPERGASFLTFVFWRVREVLEDSLKPERRDRAYAAAAERGVRVVQDVLDLGDVLNESEQVRRERLTTYRHALGAATIMGCYAEPESPEDLLLMAEERELSRRAFQKVQPRLDSTAQALLRACFWEDQTVAAAARQLGLEYDDARYRIRAALALISRMFQAGAAG